MTGVLGDLKNAIEQQQLESLIASPTVLEKCKFLSISFYYLSHINAVPPLLCV